MSVMRDGAELRLTGIAALRPFLAADGVVGSIAAAILGPAGQAVRAILFDKTADLNWGLGWNPDRTICVRERRDSEGCGP